MTWTTLGRLPQGVGVAHFLGWPFTHLILGMGRAGQIQKFFACRTCRVMRDDASLIFWLSGQALSTMFTATSCGAEEAPYHRMICLLCVYGHVQCAAPFEFRTLYSFK